jgi:hypothetical protein
MKQLKPTNKFIFDPNVKLKKRNEKNNPDFRDLVNTLFVIIYMIE